MVKRIPNSLDNVEYEQLRRPHRISSVRANSALFRFIIDTVIAAMLVALALKVTGQELKLVSKQ